MTGAFQADPWVPFWSWPKEAKKECQNKENVACVPLLLKPAAVPIGMFDYISGPTHGVVVFQMACTVGQQHGRLLDAMKSFGYQCTQSSHNRESLTWSPPWMLLTCGWCIGSTHVPTAKIAKSSLVAESMYPMLWHSHFLMGTTIKERRPNRSGKKGGDKVDGCHSSSIIRQQDCVLQLTFDNIDIITRCSECVFQFHFPADC